MNKTKKLLFFVLLQISCSFRNHNNNYSYIISIYSEHKGLRTNLNTTSHLISYENYIFEFEKSTFINDSIKDNVLKKRNYITLDTMRVNLLDIEKRIYFEFDKFNSNAKLLDKGKFSIKKGGVKLSDNQVTTNTILNENLLKDTSINNLKLKYSKEVEKNSQKKDSMISFAFFLKNSEFNSILDLMGTRPSKKYSLVGFCNIYVQEKEGIYSIISDMKPLSQREIEICNSIVNKTKKVNMFKK